MGYYNNKKLALSIFWVILGLVLMVLSITEVLDHSLYAGMGGALIAVGALQIIRNVRYRKDPEYKEKMDTALHDERNSFLHMKSWSWAGYIAILVEGAGVVVATVMGQYTVRQVLSYCVCLLVLAYWISYLILSRKY